MTASPSARLSAVTAISDRLASASVTARENTSSALPDPRPELPTLSGSKTRLMPPPTSGTDRGRRPPALRVFQRDTMWANRLMASGTFSDYSLAATPMIESHEAPDRRSVAPPPRWPGLT